MRRKIFRFEALKLLRLFVLPAIGLVCFVHSGAQHYEIRNYSVKEGVGQSQVYTLCQDKRGYMWMGTRGGGLTRFDGRNFTSYTTKNGLADNFISAVKQDVNGNLWIASNAGISVYNGRVFHNYYIRRGTHKTEINDFTFTRNGMVYVASDSGLYSFNGTRFQLVADFGHEINSVAEDRKGNIWYGTTRSLKCYEPAKSGITEFLKGKYINKVICDASGKIWAGTYSGGLYTGGAAGFAPFDALGAIQATGIVEIYQDRKGHFWFGTLSSGIYKYEPLGRNVVHITEKDGLSNNHVRCITGDREGNYWFGTSGGGVCHYFSLPFSHYDKRSGLSETYIYSVLSDSRNRLWVGTGSLGISVLDSGVFRNIGADSGFVNTKVRAMAEDSGHVIYLGTEGEGLWTFKNGSFQALRAFRGTYIRNLYVQGETIWAAVSGQGIAAFRPGYGDEESQQIRYFDTRDGLLDNQVSAFAGFDNGDLAYGTDNNGIGIISRGKAVSRKFSVNEGLPSNKIRCLIYDTAGYLWAGTAGGGIARIAVKGGRKEIEYNKFNASLNSLNIYLMVFDKKGNLFIGTEAGLDYITLDKNRNPVAVRHFGKNEGFVGIETCQNSVSPDADGNLWFGTINGLTQCNPAAITRNLIPPALGIQGVRLYYKDIVQTEFSGFAGNWYEIKSLELPYDQNHLTFDLRGIHFGNPDQVAFRWKLSGSDEDWSPESDQSSVTYSNIPPGNYVFMVIARNADGVWTTEPVKIAVKIRPPFYQTWWFRILLVVLLAGLFSLLLRIRLRKVNERNRKTAEQLKLEKKLADLEHQALRLQMNPHFIFNALNSIQAQIGEKDPQIARYNLAKFGRLMRQILDLSQKPFITLKEEIESLENYLLVEKFSSGDTFDYEVKVEEGMDTDFIKIPPMLLQPFAENAIKHGFKNLKERRGKISIAFSESDHMLHCSITDNGVGRKVAAERSGSGGESYHTSTALRVIRERLQLLHGQSGIEPVFQITDLFDENSRPSGTKIEVGIPLL